MKKIIKFITLSLAFVVCFSVLSACGKSTGLYDRLDNDVYSSITDKSISSVCFEEIERGG